MDRLRPGHRVLVEAVAGPAPNLFIRGADIENLVGCRGHHPEDFTNVFRQLAKLLFAALQGLLGLLALGDIPKEPHAPPGLAPLSPQTGGIAFEGPAVLQFNFAMVVGIRIVVKFSNPPSRKHRDLSRDRGRRQDERRLVAYGVIGLIIRNRPSGIRQTSRNFLLCDTIRFSSFTTRIPSSETSSMARIREC